MENKNDYDRDENENENENENAEEVGDFLAELDSDRFVSSEETEKEQVMIEKNAKEQKAERLRMDRERKLQMKEQLLAEKVRLKMEKEHDKADKEREKKKTTGQEEDMFSATGTPLVGKDRIVLLKKVSQYKSLFPSELKNFKVKQNASVEELNAVLTEMATLVEVGGMDEFMMSSVLSCMKLVEAPTAGTTYDIRGCADMLKNNAEFHKLCKILFIKYQVFTKVPAEMQLLILVSTTAYMCNSKNRGKSSIDSYLNQPI